jgi:hypothetical protein
VSLAFDAVKSEAAKEAGMELAAEARKLLLVTAKQIAQEIGESREDRCCWADLVKQEMQCRGLDPTALGNASGSIFKGGDWYFTGRTVKSTQVDRHSGEQKIWTLDPSKRVWPWKDVIGHFLKTTKPPTTWGSLVEFLGKNYTEPHRKT